MRKKEIKEKFEKLGEQIKSLENGQEDLYKTIRFILEAIRKYTDEPIYRVKENGEWYRYGFIPSTTLQYVYKNEHVKKHVERREKECKKN